MRLVKVVDDVGHFSHWQLDIILNSNSFILEKIILAFDGTYFSKVAIEFVADQMDGHPVMVTGVF